MADSKLSALTALAAPVTDDLVYVVDDPAGTPVSSSATVGNLLAAPWAAEVAVTGTTVLTSTAFGKSHVCSGTSADYTVTLPASSGNAGKWVWLRMATGLTRLVTVAGGGGELIDGTATRVMWAGESAQLLCDGTGWNKVAGRTIPMSCLLQSSQVTTASHDTVTQFDLGGSVYDVGGIGDPANDRVVVRRPNTYLFAGMVNFGILANDTRVIGYFYAGSAPAIYKIFGSVFVRGSSAYVAGPASHSLEAGHIVQLRGSWDVSGGSGTKDSLIANLEQKPYLSVTEAPQW